MNHSSPKAERRHTSIYLHPQPEPPNCSLFKIDFGKENIPAQKVSWNQYSQSLQQSTVSQKKKPTQKYVELESQTDTNIKFKFPLYTDRQLGIKPEYQNLLQEAYDNDDDINTRESVMNFFIDVCKRDLMQGIMDNQLIKDQQGLKSHPKFFRLYTKIKLAISIYQLVSRMIFIQFLSTCLFSILIKLLPFLCFYFNLKQIDYQIENSISIFDHKIIELKRNIFIDN